MKRSQVVFVTVVFTALLTGFLVERSHRLDTFEEFDFTAPRRVTLEALEVPFGPHAVGGQIVTAAGAPAEDVLVHLRRPEPSAQDAAPLFWTRTDSEGGFRLERLPEGHYEVRLFGIGLPNTLRSLDVPTARTVAWRLPEPLPPIPSLPELERADLAGRVLPPAALLSEELGLEGYEVLIEPTEEASPLSGAIRRRAVTGADGGFRFDGLAAGPYRLSVLPPWARGGSWPVLDQRTYRHQADAGPREAPALRPRTGEIVGRLQDRLGRPIEGALVKAWPSDRENRIWPPEGSGPDGSFSVADLPQGTYQIRIRAGAAVVEREVEVVAGERVELALPDLETRPPESVGAPTAD